MSNPIDDAAGGPTRGGLSRRDFLRLTAAGVAAGWPCRGIAGESAAGAAAARRPNVIVLFDDQLRAEVCGVYGGRSIATPNIDRLAAEGTTFDNATSTCPLCTPFRGMLQTGRYPTHTGLVLNWVEANPRQRGIAHAFQAAGYHTAFIGKWHLAAGRNKRAGDHRVTEADQQRIREATEAYRRENPETEFVPPGPARLGYRHWQAYNFHTAFTDYWFYEDAPRRVHRSGYETDIQIDLAIEFMKRQKSAPEPFFMMIAPHPPHTPFRPDMCPPGYLENVPSRLHWRPNVPPDNRHRGDPEPARCYHAMAKNVDDNLGRLSAFLDGSGLANDTILVFTADHGEMLGSHGRDAKMVPYAEAVNIPLVIRWPGHVRAGLRTDALHTPMDHFPTLCGLAGIATPAGLDGRDHSATLTKGTRDDRDAILMANYVSDWDFFDSGTRWPEWRGVRTRRHTYVKWRTGGEELYDNQDDPYQMRNLADGRQDLPALQRLRGRLKDLLAEAHDDFLPGTAYADWYDDERNLVRTALGPV